MKNIKLNKNHLLISLVILIAFFVLYTSKEHLINYSPDVFKEINLMRSNDKFNCVEGGLKPRQWEKQFCIKDGNPCYKSNSGPTPRFPDKDAGGAECVAPYSKECQEKAENDKEGFLDWSMYNPPISNGYTPNWWAYSSLPSTHLPMGANYAFSNLAYQNSLDRIYNPLRYPYRSQAFYEQGWYPNMTLPPQVIGCGGRRQGCLGGTEVTVPTVPPPIEISERNIAPVNIMTRGPQGIPQQVGVLYKIFGSLNEVYPLYGRKKYPNSDTWDYYTTIGQTGNQVKVPVITKRKNHNELQTNDVVMVAGNSAKFRTTIYQSDFPQYIPYA